MGEWELMREYKDIARAVFDNLDIIAWATDTSGTVLLSEGRGMRALGFEPGSTVGLNVLDLYRARPESVKALQRALAGEPYVTTNVHEGRARETRFTPMRDAQGALIGLAGLTIDVTERMQAQQEIDRQTEAVRKQAELLDLSHDAILTRGLDGKITYWNRGAERLYGHTRADALGRSAHALLQTRFPAEQAELDRQLLATGFWEGELTHTRADGQQVVVASRWVLKDDDGEVLEINTDITARKQAEAVELRRQATIRAQEQALQELSTPLIPITDDIVVMPLIGTMDSARARQVMQAVLEGASKARARFVILDITGVLVVDTAVAGAIVDTAHAARLLGTRVIVTGIRPEVAQTLVDIEADLRHIITCGTLQDGIARALGRRGLR